jgi:3-oxoacyl-[acyl-carrier-protein] synthase-3
MGTRIEAASISRPHWQLGGTGALKLADDAAQMCLGRAERKASELGFLINAGIYRDNNIGEPAVAAMIQEDIGANPDPPLHGGHGTFSLDVVNGACGVLTGMHILDGFLTSAAIDLGIVVAADADPQRGSNWDFPFGLVGISGRLSRSQSGFPFAPLGGAVLLSRSKDEAKGFSRFGSSTFPEFAHLLTAEVSWKQGLVPRAVAARVPWLDRGHNILRIKEGEGFATRCAECALTSASAFLQSAGLASMDIDLLVPSPTPASFPDDLSQGLGVPADRVARVDEGLEGVHTAGPIAALVGAMRKGRFDAAGNVLFVAVGAGITVSLALYHP